MYPSNPIIIALRLLFIAVGGLLHFVYPIVSPIIVFEVLMGTYKVPPGKTAAMLSA